MKWVITEPRVTKKKKESKIRKKNIEDKGNLSNDLKKKCFSSNIRPKVLKEGNFKK